LAVGRWRLEVLHLEEGVAAEFFEALGRVLGRKVC
jgi:hypothetical protein